ncbi:hypothetical protein [Roseomonas sp. WA12]
MLDESRQISEQHEASFVTRIAAGIPITAEDYLSPNPDIALVAQACKMPARTPEGVRAKAEAARWWVMRNSVDADDRFRPPQEWLAISRASDLTGRNGA